MQSQQAQVPMDKQQTSSIPLSKRLKHPSWSIRKQAYQQILYLLQSNDQLLISGQIFTIQTLIPCFQNLVMQKHSMVLLKGLECVEMILKSQKKAYNKHCIKTLNDKGLQYFPLLTQQRKAVLEKFLDILELSRIQPNFLKNKLNLPHQKSVMYVIEVIGSLNMTSLSSTLLALSKKHQKKCVRQLALQIAEQLGADDLEDNETLEQLQKETNQKKTSTKGVSNKSSSNSSCRLIIQKLSLYSQLISKKQQQFSIELLQQMPVMLQQYSSSQIPNLSQQIRLMIDDNNHIINTNGIKCLIHLLQYQRQNQRNSFIATSFPLGFLFNKFKSHKTHPVNGLLMQLVDALIKTNRTGNLFYAIGEGLASQGAKMNVKFGCALAFFRALALIFQNQDLYQCTVNQNIQSLNQDLNNKFLLFSKIQLTKPIKKTIQKIVFILQKDKKYQDEIYLIKNAIGFEFTKQNQNMDLKATKTIVKSKKAIQQYSNQKPTKTSIVQSQQVILQQKKKVTPSALKKESTQKMVIKPTAQKVQLGQINLQKTLSQILIHLNKKKPISSLTSILQKSTQQFYQCIQQKKYQMFYLCQLLENFIDKYQPIDESVGVISQFLVNLLKIVSLLKPIHHNQTNNHVQIKIQHVHISNVQQIFIISFCKLVICQDLHQILQNINRNYHFQIIIITLTNLFIIQQTHKIKKKNKKYLIQWLQSNTPAMYIDQNYYQLIEKIQQKQKKLQKQQNKQIGQQKSHQIKITNVKQQNRSPKRKIMNEKADIQRQQQMDFLQISQNHKQQQIAYQLQSINLSKIYPQKQCQWYNQKSQYTQQDHITKYLHQQKQSQVKSNKKPNQKSRQYLRHLNLQLDEQKKQNNFIRRKDNSQKEILMMLEESPFKEGYQKRQYQQLHFQDQQHDHNDQYQQQAQQQDNVQHESSQQNQHDSHNQYDDQDKYQQKIRNIQNRRLLKQQQRKEFMNRIKNQFKPIQNNYDFDHSDQQIYNNHLIISNQQEQQRGTGKFFGVEDQQQAQSNIVNVPLQSSSNQQSCQKQSQQLIKVKQRKQSGHSIGQPLDSSSLSMSGQFKYRLINAQKVCYMLSSTSNPYPHLRNLILIPFKSTVKKSEFLKQLYNFLRCNSPFQSPQPYSSLVLLTILLFSEIKEDKGLIQPLQQIYQFIAGQKTINLFVKTIVGLFHSVIQETITNNRKFLITILLKSIARIVHFVQDPLELLRDLQQFYQIGQMVYFQMFQHQYQQIKQYIQNQILQIVVNKAYQQQNQNLKSIVQNWLVTQFKEKVIFLINEINQNVVEEENEQQALTYQ